MSDRTNAAAPRFTASRRTACTLIFALVALSAGAIESARAQPSAATDTLPLDKFRQLEELLPTPNATRTASGAPGHGYWQQKADYVIAVTLDEEAHTLTGEQTITYFNHSPDTLRYLWVQLDQNIFRGDSDSQVTRPSSGLSDTSFRRLRATIERPNVPGGVTIEAVRDATGADLEHTIVKTMMRIDLPRELRSGESTTFSIDWHYPINDTSVVRGRTGYETFEEDGNTIYEIAHWFPRMAPYEDVNGWHNKQFLGSGEFSLEFGDYLVRITVPDDHVVSATGELQNPDNVLTAEQRERLASARTAEEPVFVVTPDEAKANEKEGAEGTKTWIFSAKNVRDFAWASSRKFIWDALGTEIEGRPVLAMSFYPNEGEPLWSKYSTHAILHTLEVYSHFAFPYPYPVAQSVNGPVGGMEYPMICFNGPRPEKDGTYSSRTKYGLISVIIHEVGHNWFPMIVNSDERQWTWMDEGINTFVQYLAESSWEENYPSRRGEPKYITGYMSSSRQMPIMTNSESLLQFGSNAYAKPATALNILRETVLGRELFDFAFREYSQRWMFKRPQPADFFRTLEDASGIDLDWFWRGWFYTTENVDLALGEIRTYTIDSRNPEVEKGRRRAERDAEPETLGQARNRESVKRTDRYPQLLDFYNEYDELDVTDKERTDYEKLVASLEDWQKELLETSLHFTSVEFKNEGGLVMPIVLGVTYDDGTQDELRVPAEIWRRNAKSVSKLLITEKPIVSFDLDPNRELADVDRSNNVFPPRIEENRIRLDASSGRFGRGGRGNPMRDAQRAAEKAASDDDSDTDESGGANERSGRGRGGNAESGSGSQ